MKRLLILLFSIFIITNAFSQESDSIKSKGKLTKGERFVFDFYTDIWQGAPDNIKIKGFNRGINFYTMQDFPLGVSNFSFAIGLGVSAHNMRSNALPTAELDTSGVETGNTIFAKIPEAVKYDKNKLTLAYIDVPIEFRFRTRAEKSKRFRMAVGGKIGYMISNYTKYKGKDPLDINEEIKYKSYNIENVNPLRYGITGRVGYGWANVMVYYSLTNLFEDGKGAEMYPISVGISIIPF